MHNLHGGKVFHLALDSLDFPSIVIRSSHVAPVAILQTAKRGYIIIVLESFAPVARNVLPVQRTGHQMQRTLGL